MEVDAPNWLYVSAEAVGEQEWEAVAGMVTRAVRLPAMQFVAVLRLGDVVNDDNSTDLFLQTIKACIKGPMPSVRFVSATFSELSREGPLLENREGSFRFQGADMNVFGEPSFFWPPPILSSDSSSSSWEFERPKLSEKDAHELLSDLEVVRGGIFRLVEDGIPHSSRYVLRASNGWPKEDCVRGHTRFKYVARCGLCRRSMQHEAALCPLLSTLNKIRPKEGLPLVVVTKQDRVVMTNEKPGVDLEKEMAKLSASVNFLTARIGKLEEAVRGNGGPKRSADEGSEQPRPSKKAKLESKGNDAPRVKRKGKKESKKAE
jgi:hypothetical protein